MTDERAARLILGLRRQGVTDARVLEAMEAVDRSVFVHPQVLDQAWEDFGEAEDAYWSYAYMYQPLNYEREAMTCRLFQTRVARL